MKTLQSEQCGEIKIMLPFQGVGREGGDGPQGAALGWVRLALWAGMEAKSGFEIYESRDSARGNGGRPAGRALRRCSGLTLSGRKSRIQVYRNTRTHYCQQHKSVCLDAPGFVGLGAHDQFQLAAVDDVVVGNPRCVERLAVQEGLLDIHIGL